MILCEMNLAGTARTEPKTARYHNFQWWLEGVVEYVYSAQPKKQVHEDEVFEFWDSVSISKCILGREVKNLMVRAVNISF